MNRKNKLITILFLVSFYLASSAYAEEVRTIKLNEDRDQKNKGSKVYELKHVRADDIAPWVSGAVKRYNPQGDAQMLRYKDGQKSYLVVSTGVDLLPYIDDMIAKLDRPGGKRDAHGSVVQDDGTIRYTYRPEYRASQGLVDSVQDLKSDGPLYIDPLTNLIFGKDSASHADLVLKWLKALDRPEPQLQLTINVYDINENAFEELGVDYIDWKNGPGASLFGTGYSYTHLSSGADVSSIANSLNITDRLSSSLGGFAVAPQFDATFLRLLAQKGKAKVATSGTLSLINDYTTPDPGVNNYSGAKFKLKFTPNYQNISKDANMNISVDQQALNFSFYLRRPVIAYNEPYSDNRSWPDVENANPGSTNFGWVLQVEDTVEQVSTTGQPVINQYNLNGWLSLAVGAEKLIGTFEKDHKVNANNSVPFLGDIPGLKYLFGSSVESRTHSRLFVTVSTNPVNVNSKLPEYATEIIDSVNKDIQGDSTDNKDKTEKKN